MFKTFLLGLTLSGLSFAALPPYYQSVRELQAILENKQVAAKLAGSGTIKSISHQDVFYTIFSGDCGLSVEVKYLPNTMVGPAKFELVVGEINCLP